MYPNNSSFFLFPGKGADSVTSEQVDEFYKQVGKCALVSVLCTL